MLFCALDVENDKNISFIKFAFRSKLKQNTSSAVTLNRSLFIETNPEL